MGYFTNVIKPTHLCNLDCRYCYNDDVRRPVMDLATMRRTVEQTLAYARAHIDRPEVSFVWHGGEPTIAGLPFFREAVAVQHEHRDGVRIENGLQTNGLLLDDEWAEFLLAHGFSVGISLDGPAAIHDAARQDRRGNGSFDRVLASIDLLRRHGVPFGVCVVVSRLNVDRLDEVYEFLATERLPFNIIPLNRSGAARAGFDELGIEPDAYGPAWISMFDRWFDADEDYVYAQDFVLKARAVAAGVPTDCVGQEQCADTNIAVDPLGDVYSCASLSGHDDTLLGNLTERSLAAIMDDATAMHFRSRPVDPHCAVCRWQHVCHGGCQARSYKYFGSTAPRDYYCPSLYAIYEHVATRISEKIDRPFTPAGRVPAAPRPLASVSVPVRITRKPHAPTEVAT